MKEPKIRFKGFSGEWKECTLSNIITVNSGKDYKHLEKGTIPVYGTGGYMLSVNTSLSEHDAIGIGRKGTIDKPQYLKAPFWTVDTLFFLTTNNGDNLDFLFNLSQNIRWQKYDESTGVPSLSKNNIDKIKTCIPNKFEQQSVASFFTSLDAQISASTSRLASLKQMKAASLQAMFPQEGETIPKVRFKGFEGEWKTRSLNNYAKKRTEKNVNRIYNVTLTNSAEFGIIDQRHFFDHDISNSENIDGYFVVRDKDFVYNPRISASAPVGPINQNKLGYPGVMSPLYLVFEVKGINHDFLEIYFHTALWHKYMFDNGNSGARFDRLTISDDDFMRMPIPDISLAEQQSIASFFTSLDRQIALHTQRLEKLKQIKAACLDKMFV
jgi:type I restriction enzyme S subunit